MSCVMPWSLCPSHRGSKENLGNRRKIRGISSTFLVLIRLEIWAANMGPSAFEGNSRDS